ncbi:MAG: GldG family protein [Puniceicoccales bacterium]|jgi:hypothetical protein|nr:GldG family protein [Puniceicoccales bacterium]
MLNFEHSNKIRRLCRLFFTLSSSLLALLIIFLSGHYFYRTYAGSNGDSKLSANTLELMATLKSPLEIYVLMESEGADADNLVRRDIGRLLDGYADCAHGSAVTIEFVEPADIGARNLIEPTVFLPAKSILLKCAQRRKVIAIEELYAVRNGEIVGFCGERVLSGAIGELALGRKKTAYFLSGHGEYDVGDVSASHGLSTLASILRSKNYEVKIFDFRSEYSIPEEADLVLLWGPKVALLPTEVAALGNFLDERGGKIMIGLSGVSDGALAEFLAEHGLWANIRAKISPLADHGKIWHDLVVNQYAPHGITRELINFKMSAIFGEAYEVREADWTADGDQFAVTNLLQVDGIAEGVENCDKFIIAALSEKRAPIAVDILAGKLLVFGCSDFAVNSRINVLGNRMLFCGAVDYMCTVDKNMDMGCYPIAKYRLTLAEKQYYLIAALSAVICCGFIVLGVIVYFFRRK